jgi:hypothetical protein
LPPLKTAQIIGDLIEEAKTKNVNDVMAQSFFFVKRTAESALDSDFDF